jgi:hypothetical protein
VDKLWGKLGNLGVFGEMGRGKISTAEWNGANGILAEGKHYPQPRNDTDGNACLGVARRRLKTYG